MSWRISRLFSIINFVKRSLKQFQIVLGLTRARHALSAMKHSRLAFVHSERADSGGACS
jgi:hypothetical protein